MTAPKILSVQAHPPTILLVEFVGGEWRRYDMAPLLETPAFSALHDPSLFLSVYVDRGGYGLIWNEDIDLAEYELWNKGAPIPPPNPDVLQAADSFPH